MVQKRKTTTKEDIKEALIQLLSEEKFENISISKLCKRAGINRGTFYLHYEDKYQMIDSFKSEIISQLYIFLEKERELEYKVRVLRDYADMQLLSIEFDAIDNSKIYAELAVKKDNNKGLILEIPDYEEVPSGMIKLMKYCTLGYGGATIHVRGDRGRSENRQPASIYFPFVTNNENDEIYYNYTYQVKYFRVFLNN